jgi:DNA-binding Lrp family transcriptional regulator
MGCFMDVSSVAEYYGRLSAIATKKAPKETRNMGDHITLDRTDAEILRTLQMDGRITNKDLAAAVDLSASACHDRVRRLTDEGVITRFTAELDMEAIGIGLETLLMVQLQRHTRTVIDAFQTHCRSLEEVVALWHLTGSSDYVVRVVTRDTTHLRDFLMDSFTTRPEVARLQTHTVLWSERKQTWPIWADSDPG